MWSHPSVQKSRQFYVVWTLVWQYGHVISFFFIIINAWIHGYCWFPLYWHWMECFPFMKQWFRNFHSINIVVSSNWVKFHFWLHSAFNAKIFVVIRLCLQVSLCSECMGNSSFCISVKQQKLFRLKRSENSEDHSGTEKPKEFWDRRMRNKE